MHLHCGWAGSEQVPIVLFQHLANATPTSIDKVGCHKVGRKRRRMLAP